VTPYSLQHPGEQNGFGQQTQFCPVQSEALLHSPAVQPSPVPPPGSLCAKASTEKPALIPSIKPAMIMSRLNDGFLLSS
jgi:hypothetical protein